jgi:hypothetical protein
LELNYKFVLGAVSVLIVLGNHCYYLYLTYQERIRPHAFTILIYFIVTISVSLGMFGEGASAVALRMFIPAPLYILMLFFSVRRGIEYIRRIDGVMLGLSLLALPLWWLTASPRAAILFLAIVESAGIVPAFRKAYVLPFEDSLVSPLLSAIAMLLAAIAVNDPAASWATTLYLIYWVLICVALAGLIGWRRRIIPRGNQPITIKPTNKISRL